MVGIAASAVRPATDRARRAAAIVSWSVGALAAAALFVAGLAAEWARSGAGSVLLIAVTGAVWWSAGVVVAVRGWARGPLLTATFLVVFGTAAIHGTDQLLAPDPRWGPLIALLQFAGGVLLPVFLFTFPDGRFVPRWTWVPVVAWAVLNSDDYLLDWLPLPPGGGPVGAVLAVALLLGGAAAQVHRYRAVSDSTARRQTRVVLLGCTTAALGIAALTVPTLVEPDLTTAGTTSRFVLDVALAALFLLVPVTVAVATLRHRLWDIEPVVAGAAVYAALTLAVVVLYAGVVAGLGQLLGDAVAAPLGVAGVAVAAIPLRQFLQRRVNRMVYGHREEPYRVLSELGRRLEDPLLADGGLQVVVDSVCSALKVSSAQIVLGHGSDARPVASAGRQIGVLERWPLGTAAEPLGELLVGRRSATEPLGARDRRLLDDLARRAGAAALGFVLAEDLQRARQRLVAAREEERRRLRRDLHDGLGSQLAALGVQAAALRRLVRRDPDTVESVLAEHAAELQGAVADVRRLVHGLRPPALDELGLVGALRGLAERLIGDVPGLVVTTNAPAELRPLPAAVETAAHWITAEALTNVVRHARASRCVVELDVVKLAGAELAGAELRVTDALRLRITDDGVGLPAVRVPGVGLASMRERAVELGGRCEIEQVDVGGTAVDVTIPVTA